MFDEFGKVVLQMQEDDLEVARSRGTLAIQQTQRNKMKAELMNALHKGFETVGDQYGFDVYMTHDGVIFEIKNDNVLRRVNRLKDKENEADITGYISLEFNVKIKNLDYDAEIMEEAYQADLKEAEMKAQQKEAAKREKILRDAELRASKARLREQKIASLLKDGEQVE